jgi:hypothetical protein
MAARSATLGGALPGGATGSSERRSGTGLGGHLRRRSAFGLGPARPAQSNPLHASGQQDVIRPEDRSCLAGLSGRTPLSRRLSRPFRRHFGGISQRAPEWRYHRANIFEDRGVGWVSAPSSELSFGGIIVRPLLTNLIVSLPISSVLGRAPHDPGLGGEPSITSRRTTNGYRTVLLLP